MSCCGQKRRQWQTPAAKQEAPKPAPELVLENPVAIVYLGYGSYLVKGPQTGYLYLFGNQQPRLLIDGRDASFLLTDTKRFSPV